eukprot:m.388850 g.388850  ORF g.388850 m.388850 type:complete len:66 (-) comp56326_c0_seq21:1302-1499(-)
MEPFVHAFAQMTQATLRNLSVSDIVEHVFEDNDPKPWQALRNKLDERSCRPPANRHASFREEIDA